MSYFNLVTDLPHATAYDAAFPTRSTENYAHQLHEILVDMDDAGYWWITDNTPSDGELGLHQAWIRNAVKVVFDYAEGAISTFRATGTPTLAEPTTNEIAIHYGAQYPELQKQQLYIISACYKIMYLIYYMWKTEDDPLLLKEKLTELLISWPLTDTEIILSEEGGSQLRVVPAWKNVDL